MEENIDKINSGLKLIPIYEKYMEYMIDIIVKLPRTEKFCIGTEFKSIMYDTYVNIMYLQYLEQKSKMYYLNKIDANLNIQRTFLRIMVKNNWISNEKFKKIINIYIMEIGKIIGGLLKYYGKKSP